MSSKMGRPLSDNPRNQKLFIRLTEKENKTLEQCCEISKKSKAEIIRYGLEMVADKLLERQ